VAEETTLSVAWLLILGIGLWTVVNVMGFDLVIQTLIRRVIRKIPPLAKSYAELDLTIAIVFRIDRTYKKLRTYGISRLAVREDRQRLAFLLGKAETCERLAVWTLLAAPLSYLTLTGSSWLRIAYPVALVVLAGSLIASATDHVRHASNLFENGKVEFSFS
jgi:hypothetical protein